MRCTPVVYTIICRQNTISNNFVSDEFPRSPYHHSYMRLKLILLEKFRGRHGGVEIKRRGVENLTNDTPPKKGFWTPPLLRYAFHPPQVSVLCFSCTKIHDRADQKLFWRGPEIFGRARSLVRFTPPHTFCTPPYHCPTLPSDTNYYFRQNYSGIIALKKLRISRVIP